MVHKKIGAKIKSEITDPIKSIFSSPDAAGEATKQGDANIAVKVEAEKKKQSEAALGRKRRPLRLKGRRSTILAGANPDLESQSLNKRKTLLGG